MSLGAGCITCTDDWRSKLRLAFHLAFFQALFTVLGWLAGATVDRFINGIDHWIAFGLLSYVGIKMIRSGLNSDHESQNQGDPTRGKTMVMLSVATSIDAMAVGLSMAMLKQPVVLPALVIGLVTFGLSLTGLIAGSRLGQAFGKRMEILGGIILISIGIKILIEHL